VDLNLKIEEIREKCCSYFKSEFLSIKGFSFKKHSEWDLFGTIDAIFLYYILNKLSSLKQKESPLSQKVLSCQLNSWLNYRNSTRNSKEHATAYAIGALILLSDKNHNYIQKLKPINGIRDLVSNIELSEKWIRSMGSKIRFDDPAKYLGWHYIWRSSHIGGGVGAIVAMLSEQIDFWWGEGISNQWLNWYFNWLDRELNPKTGFWQRAFWNVFYSKPNIIDLGGVSIP